MTTPLEQWKGEFGDEYTERNADLGSLPARQTMFREIFAHTRNVRTVLEVGANVGLNAIALHQAPSKCFVTGHEPNELARKRLYRVADTVLEKDLDEGYPHASHDLVFTCGVLIHIPPDELLSMCTRIHRAAKRYVLSIEYFSPEPQKKEYREQDGLLWTRDFGAFWLENFRVRHVAHGFFWKPATGLDNLTWWLFER